MAALQRSAVSFRRQGSSGVVWNDRFFSGELKPTSTRDDAAGELRHSRSVGSSSSAARFERSRSSGVHRMEVIVSPSPTSSNGDPSSPKFAGCGFCAVFGRPIGGARHHKSSKRRSE